MLHHVSIGVADVARAASFYDAVLKALGYRRVMEVLPYGIAYGTQAPEFWVQLPANQNSASSGNGVHVAFKAATKDAVAAFHRAALGAGGTDEGGPGPRPDYGPDYFGAFARDPDGNKIEAVLAPEPQRAAATPPAAEPPAARARRGKTKTRRKRPAAKKAKATPRKKAKKAPRKAARKKAKRAR